MTKVIIPVRNVYELPRVRKQRPVLVQTRKKKAGKAVNLLIRKGYLRREKLPTGELEPSKTVWLDTTNLRDYVRRTQQQLYQSGRSPSDFVLLVNPGYLQDKTGGDPYFYAPVKVCDPGRNSLLGMDVYVWDGIDTILTIPKSVFKNA